MKRFTCLVLFSGCAAAVVAADTASVVPTLRAVIPPVRRQEALQMAADVLAPREPTWKTIVADLPDPFFRSNFVQEEQKPADLKPAVAQRSETDVLEAAAATLNPTGIMMVDGENYLLLGGKRHKVGSQITVTIDGILYKIVISGIEGKTYSLQLNEHELRRQLK